MKNERIDTMESSLRTCMGHRENAMYMAILLCLMMYY